MVKRLLGPEEISAYALSKEVGVPQSTLSRWAQRARTLERMSDKRKSSKQRQTHRTAEEKLRLVMESSRLSEEELGAFLRREGLHSADLDAWRRDALSGLGGSPKKKRTASTETVSATKKRLRELERELRRKDKALAEVTALLVLQKKLEAILGDEDDGTPSRRGT